MKVTNFNQKKFYRIEYRFGAFIEHSKTNFLFEEFEIKK